MKNICTLAIILLMSCLPVSMADEAIPRLEIKSIEGTADGDLLIKGTAHCDKREDVVDNLASFLVRMSMELVKEGGSTYRVVKPDYTCSHFKPAAAGHKEPVKILLQPHRLGGVEPGAYRLRVVISLNTYKVEDDTIKSFSVAQAKRLIYVSVYDASGKHKFAFLRTEVIETSKPAKKKAEEDKKKKAAAAKKAKDKGESKDFKTHIKCILAGQKAFLVIMILWFVFGFIRDAARREASVFLWLAIVGSGLIALFHGFDIIQDLRGRLIWSFGKDAAWYYWCHGWKFWLANTFFIGGVWLTTGARRFLASGGAAPGAGVVASERITLVALQIFMVGSEIVHFIISP